MTMIALANSYRAARDIEGAAWNAYRASITALYAAHRAARGYSANDSELPLTPEVLSLGMFWRRRYNERLRLQPRRAR